MLSMKVKLVSAAVVLSILFCYSCKKTKTTTTTSALELAIIANIDSMKGYYAGTTSGDSVYYYTDTSGTVKYGIRSFSWPDSLVVTSADTASITVVSRTYTVTFPYSYYYTSIDSVSYLRQYTPGDGGYLPFNAFLVDTANGINHLAINISYGANKHMTSNFALYKRQ